MHIYIANQMFLHKKKKKKKKKIRSGIILFVLSSEIFPHLSHNSKLKREKMLYFGNSTHEKA